MALRELSREDREALRDRAEAAIELAMRRAVKRFLSRVKLAALSSLSPGSILAGAAVQPHLPDPEASMLSLGEVSGWWAEEVDGPVQQAVRDEWRTVYKATSDGMITQTSLDGLDDYMGNVTDRLVRGIEPPLPVDAFDRVRVSITEGAAQGWSRDQTAGRIAAELGWETSAPYWRSELANANAAIDAILDPLGPPGTPLREFTRLHDRAVRSLQADRSRAISHLDAEKSYWNTRATRIARTEATAANGYASLQALKDEGVLTKEWLATGDARTRAEHLDADGQTVGIDEEFIVGFDALQFPGDPVGAPENVINCRCTITEGNIENPWLEQERADRGLSMGQGNLDRIGEFIHSPPLTDQFGMLDDRHVSTESLRAVNKLMSRKNSNWDWPDNHLNAKANQAGVSVVKVINQAGESWYEYGERALILRDRLSVTLAKLRDMNPALFDSRVQSYVFTPSADLARPYYASFNPATWGLKVTPDMYLGESYKTMAKEIAIGAKVPVKAGAEMEATLTHEYGHAIWDGLSDAQKNEALAGMSKALPEGYGTKGIVLDIGDGGFGEWASDMYATAAVRRGVSSYGADSTHELVAEAFTEYVWSPAPRPVATALGQWYETKFGMVLR